MCNDIIQLRRYEDDLNVGGMGVIMLGAWDILKVLIYALMNIKDEFRFEEFAEGDEMIAAAVIAVIIAVLVLLFFLVFKIHLYIGLNASRAARGEPYKKGYYTGAIILLVLSVSGTFSYIFEFKDLANIDTTLASLLVDLTTVYILWTVISSTRKIRKLKSSQTQTQTQTQE